jgi:hypothetical protein
LTGLNVEQWVNAAWVSLGLGGAAAVASWYALEAVFAPAKWYILGIGDIQVAKLGRVFVPGQGVVPLSQFESF